jgi:hypothetical protein
MTIAQAFNEIAVAQGGTAAKSGAITAAIDALNDALAGSDQPQAKTIEQAVRLLGEHIGGGGGGSLGATIMFGASTEGGDPIMAEYRIGIGESVAAMAFAPEAIAAASGSSVDIVISELGGDTVTGNETVTAEFRTDDNQIAFTDFDKSFKDDALHIEFTMPNVDADLFLAFTVSAAK